MHRFGSIVPGVSRLVNVADTAVAAPKMLGDLLSRFKPSKAMALLPF